MKLNLKRPIVFFDLETTGVDTAKDRIVEISMVKVMPDGEEIVIYGPFEAYGAIQKYIEDHGYNLISGEFERIPLDTKEVTPEQRESIEKLIEKFEEDEDVTNVFHNMKEAESEE